jgi:hypothetical protein
MFFHEQRFPREAFICRCKCLYFKCLSWLNIGCYEVGCLYLCFSGFYHNTVSPVIGFWYCTGILCCQLKCAFASLPTVWAVSPEPQVLKCVSIRSLIKSMRPSWWIPKCSQVVCTCTVTLFYLTTFICQFLPLMNFACVCVVRCPFWDFLFFPSVCPDKCQYSTSN